MGSCCVRRPLHDRDAPRGSQNRVCHAQPTRRARSVWCRTDGKCGWPARLEVTSSGTLHFGLTPEKLFAPHESLPWNPLIARTFYRRGIIEEWGRGTLKMVELTTAAGLPRPEIEDAGGCVTVRFRHGHYVPSKGDQAGLTDLQQAILALLDRADEGLALREIRARLEPQASERQVMGFGGAEESGTGRGRRPWSCGAVETCTRPIGCLVESYVRLIRGLLTFY